MTDDKIKLVEITYQDSAITMVATMDLLYEDVTAPDWLQECQQKLREVNILMSKNHRYFGKKLESKPVTVTDE